MRCIIDTHTHLNELSDVESTLRDCASAGVSDVIALGVDLASNRRQVEIRSAVLRGREDERTIDETFSGIRLSSERISTSGEMSGRPSSIVHVALGLHPGNITSPADTEACFAFMREHIKEAVAIGETGLDFWYKWVRKDDEKKREQQEVFDRHLALAREFDLPVVIHSRGAWRDCLDLAVRAGIKKAEFHWYSGPLDVLKDILDAGFLVSFTPALGYSPEHRKAAELAPLEKVLIETDTPVAFPVPQGAQGTGHKAQEEAQACAPGARCPVPGAPRVPSTPKDVWRTLKLLSELRGVPEDEVLRTVNANAKRFFGI